MPLIPWSTNPDPSEEALMRKWIPALVVAGLAAGACGDATNDDVIQQDTTLHIRPDTTLIERTITEDTIHDPDLSRDTLSGDTLRDTLPR
jgi:hypothetical protein